MEINIEKSLIGTLGIEMKEISDGKVVATMPVDERTRQPLGLLHGGASVALAETVASVGGIQLVDSTKQAVVGLEINANHVRGVRSGHVIAEGNIIHRGKSTMVWDVKIRDNKDQLICISRCTLAIIDLPKSE
ncbi:MULTISPECIES: hotdog fold thioesterase [unclassified Peribacillus]|jgi:1,4-dihydroxy-2-naphthoyl-CoA hydrolase|uniref:hotdog fold thioesterase n=1 Tax=unclassified Peribacillus TaxID=2675266 RepID=UPI001914162E|nr:MULTISPECIES: hotdog fold thioesterase [unclassified Peribacillus]MBK5443790.1 hotdog fold thioesterase [Peribacillus sp. TH24]MBK5461492.1 hotdog fold thioesterase [Peribacillus sp. TH27]MBK5485187.1 hotdog fold thioesterase [Peribacillus sp. TH16]MBK5499631.1 hotdog fold thioesterase [Peribacillus sp. TH14]WMX55283.1 hotdog fold thioesterase [Peribacillus sp. R9-11]